MANWPSRLDYKLPAKAAEDVKLLAAWAGRLHELVVAASRQNPKIRFDDILEPISKETGYEIKDLRRIFNTIENIRDIKRDLGNIDAALEKLIKAVDQETGVILSGETEQIKSALLQYGEDNPVTLTLKAQKLTYNRERLLHDAEIITDARPIFDSSGTKIIEFVITHTLVTRILVDGQFERRFVSLDHADIIGLRKACDRAITKAKTLREALGQKWSARVLRDES